MSGRLEQGGGNGARGKPSWIVAHQPPVFYYPSIIDYQSGKLKLNLFQYAMNPKDKD